VKREKLNPLQPVAVLPVKTSEGTFIARYSEKGLTVLEFPSSEGNGSAEHAYSPPPPLIRQWHRVTALALKRALSGRAARVLPPLDLSAGTGFQQRVWQVLLKIPKGGTRSYGEVARAVGNRRGSRAVGAACGANPIPVFVPCHRVLAANRKLGGYSGGSDWKRKLLWREEVRDWWRNGEAIPD
jgi:O-6-methylguanine DNA methyltransferase